MGIGRTRELAGPIGCQAVINGEVCHRESNATVHRPRFGSEGDNPKYHEFVAPIEGQKENDA